LKSGSAALSCHIEVCYPSGRKRWRHCAVKRREFITLLGGAAAAWPLAARAQQPEQMRRIGVLMPWAADNPVASARIAAFQHELQQLGWTAGRNIRFDTRWGRRQYRRNSQTGGGIGRTRPGRHFSRRQH